MEKAKIETSDVDALIDALQSNLNSAAISSDDRAMLNYAVKLSSTPGAIDSADVELLRDEGFNELAIHDICCVVGYFEFVNRVAEGLGVELEKKNNEP